MGARSALGLVCPLTSLGGCRPRVVSEQRGRGTGRDWVHEEPSAALQSACLPASWGGAVGGHPRPTLKIRERMGALEEASQGVGEDTRKRDPGGRK